MESQSTLAQPAIPPLPDLPAGLTVRPARLDEVENLLRPAWALDTIYNSSPDVTVQDFTADLKRPGFDLEKDTRAIFDAAGACVAYGDVISETPHVRNFLYGAVHPDWHGQGLGTWLTRWGLSRVAERIPEAPENAEVLAQSWFYHDNSAAEQLLQNEGFELERLFYEMAYDLRPDTPPEPLPMPADITVRRFDPERDTDALFDAYIATFRDHFGYIERPREAAFARWRFMVLDTPYYDPNLITLAEEDGKVVGYAVTHHSDEASDSDGYVHHLGVVREWRRRGLASALLSHVFADYHARGSKRVVLGVDAYNPTGALKLYETAGMYVKSSTKSYRFRLREGEQISVS